MQEYYIYRDHEGNQYCKGDLGEGYGIYEKLAYAKNGEWIFSFRQKWCLSNKNETEIDESAVNVGHISPFELPKKTNTEVDEADIDSDINPDVKGILSNHMPEIEKILTLSTAHVSEETMDFLQEAALDTAGVVNSKSGGNVIAYTKGECGYFISVQSLDLEGDIPADLHDALILARKAECNWLCLDADGKIVPYIPMYERN